MPNGFLLSALICAHPRQNPYLANSNAFPVVHHSYNYYRISAAAFCHHFRIKPRATMLFQNVDLDPEDVMTLDLMNTVTVTRGAR